MSLLDVNFDVNQAIKDAEAALGKYGPAIWNAAQHQVAATRVITLVWAIALTVVLAVFVAALPFVWRGKANDDSDGLAATLNVVAVLSALIAAVAVWSCWYQLVAAPDWAALQLLKP